MTDTHNRSAHLNTLSRWSTIICGSILILIGGTLLGGVTIPAELVGPLLICSALLAFLGALSFTAFAVTEGLKPQEPQDALERRRKVSPVPGIKLPLFFVALATATASSYAAHIFVWNPQVAVPGLEISEIYRQLVAAHEFSQRLVVLQGIVSAVPLALAVPTHLWLRKKLTYSPARAVGLCSAAAALSLTNLWLSWGWHMGMGLADTFGISGGDYAPTKIFMPLALVLFSLAALYFTLRPVPNHRPNLWQEETAA